MDKVRFLRYYTEFGYDYHTDNSNMLLASLAHFLLIEVVCFGSIRWKRLINALEEDGDSTSGNMIDIEKRGKNFYLGYVYDDLENPCERLEISKEELFRLMVEWERLMQEKPDEIILTHNDGKFELIGKNN
jgi:hypothetical protein